VSTGADDGPLLRLSRASPLGSEINGVKPTYLPLLTPEETPAGTPDVRNNTPIPIPTGPDLRPVSNGQLLDITLDIAPPPAIQGMPPLSATAMSSFASAAKGVTTKEELDSLDNKEGVIVLSGTA